MTTLTVAQAASLLQVDKMKIYDLCHCPSSGFPHLRLGRRIVIPRASFEAWVEARAQEQFTIEPGTFRGGDRK